jgi:hypothetical protein
MPRVPNGQKRPADVTDAELVEAIVTIMLKHLRLFSPEINADQLSPVAANLLQMIRRAESQMALEQYVGDRLFKLFAAPNPYAAIVQEARAVVENSN